MKKFLLLALLPVIAFAAARQDYAQQWPLQLSRSDAGAYRVVLTPQVYQQLQSRDAADLQVIDADGNPVATALVGPEEPLSAPVRKVQAAFFKVNAPADAAGMGDFNLMIQRDSDGNIRNVSTQLSQRDTNTANYLWLIDVSQMSDAVAELELEWPQPSASFDLAWRLEGSDDLTDWRVLDPRVRLIDLTQGNNHLHRNRVPVPHDARYLRLIPLQRNAAAPAFSTVTAVLKPEAKVANWQWLSLSPQGHVGDAIFYTLQGRFPIERAEVSSDGNAINQWAALRSRESDTPKKKHDYDAQWQWRSGPWVSYQLTDQGRQVQSAARAFMPTRDRYWGLQAEQDVNGELPVLRLGYRAETLVFIAQGNPPYALAAGSARVQRQDAPLNELINDLRKQRGEHWQPAEAVLGEMSTLAGEQALQPAPQPRDWKTWLLWGLLIAGAALVAGFAFSLLRGKPAA